MAEIEKETVHKTASNRNKTNQIDCVISNCGSGGLIRLNYFTLIEAIATAFLHIDFSRHFRRSHWKTAPLPVQSDATDPPRHLAAATATTTPEPARHLPATARTPRSKRGRGESLNSTTAELI